MPPDSPSPRQPFDGLLTRLEKNPIIRLLALFGILLGVLTGISALVQYLASLSQTPPTRVAVPTIAVRAINPVVITTIYFDGTGKNEPDEYVEIRNQGISEANLSGWTLADDDKHVFRFVDFSIQVGQTCRIYTNEDHPELCGLNRHSGAAIWDNDHECGHLRDSQGVEVSKYCY